MCLFGACRAQAQILTGVQTITDRLTELYHTHLRDAEGNIYISFSTSNSVVVGSSTLLIANDTLVGYGSGSFVAKIDPGGKLVWTSGFDSNIEAMAFTSDGNIMMTGGYSFSFYLYKVDPDGKVLWSYTEGTMGGAWGIDVIVDAEGNSYVTGTARSSGLFGILLEDVCCPDHDFLVKFDRNGKLLWCRASSLNQYTYGRALAFDPQGNIVLAGQYVYDMKIGNFTMPSHLGWTSAYLASFSPAGDVQWAREYGGNAGHCQLADLVIDTDGSMYITGGFNHTATLDGHVLTTQDDYDFYVAKLSPTGDVTWIKNSGSTGQEKGDYLLLTSDGLVVTAMIMGDFTLDGSQLTNVTETRAIAAKLTKDGDVVWLHDFGPVDFFYTDIYYRKGYQLLKISDHCFSAGGEFNGTLLPADSPPIVSKDNDVFIGTISDALFDQPDAGDDVVVELCETGETTIALPATTAIEKLWSLTKGTQPTLTPAGANAVNISNIAYGETVLEWIVSNCAVSDSKRITIHRTPQPEQPAISGLTNYCSNSVDHAPAIVSNGSDVTWYADPSLQTIVATGNTYPPKATTTLYVTQKNDGCESASKRVDITVNPQPPPPVVEPAAGCASIPLQLQATGDDIKWYRDENTWSEASGNTYTVQFPDAGRYIFSATQSQKGCESDKTTISVDIRLFSPDDILLSNIVTPNNDGKNDTFLIPAFGSENCLGNFRQVTVVNRWGEVLYKNSNRDFQWAPGDASVGTYFFKVEFEKQKFQGWISVIR